MQDLLLSAIDARILGVLMEKQLTTPDQYPLTLNSLVTACNQKTSREPVSSYSSGEVGSSLNELRNNKLVEVEYGSRAERYHQKLSRVLGLDKRKQAILTIMLLRGPQTAGDLLTRSQRMAEFDGIADMEELLETLCNKSQPMIMRIAKRAGQRDDRYMHLLCGEIDLSSLPEPSASAAGSATASNAELVKRVEVLERKLALVMAQLDLQEDSSEEE
ncbi:YceH family protein [Halioxenophilus aromaticivorans]